jgi:hypothetical protein
MITEHNCENCVKLILIEATQAEDYFRYSN